MEIMFPPTNGKLGRLCRWFSPNWNLIVIFIEFKQTDPFLVGKLGKSPNYIVDFPLPCLTIAEGIPILEHFVGFYSFWDNHSWLNSAKLFGIIWRGESSEVTIETQNGCSSQHLDRTIWCPLHIWYAILLCISWYIVQYIHMVLHVIPI